MNYGYWISIPLLLALFFYKKKRKDWAEVAKISLIPGLFNIYEPLMFGLPLVLNPFMLIPMILTPLISGISAYLATVAGIIPYCTGVALPITTPMILAGMLSTNSITGGLLQLLLIPLLAAMWYLFLSIQDRSERASGLYHEEE
ncbi:PTS system oligo-beta-mannoside-specific EIIC component [bioreactor metagenome]|uniref:PTS system oligo-beta-mannoside-specific EIIC component n=1 Tax=bioreactor metagenome TaxID=1076179 RepID=A0A645CHD5_9ZZZZ